MFPVLSPWQDRLGWKEKVIQTPGWEGGCAASGQAVEMAVAQARRAEHSAGQEAAASAQHGAGVSTLAGKCAAHERTVPATSSYARVPFPTLPPQTLLS